LVKILKENQAVDVNWLSASTTDEIEREGALILEVVTSSALHQAVCKGHDAIVSLLLAHPAIDVNLMSQEGFSPIMLACYLGKTSCVRELLKDIRVKLFEPKWGNTPFQWAAVKGLLDIVKLWIASGREIELAQPGRAETDVIPKAKKKGHSEVVSLLESFAENPTKTRGEVKKELGIAGQFSAFYLFLYFFFFSIVLNLFVFS